MPLAVGILARTSHLPPDAEKPGLPLTPALVHWPFTYRVRSTSLPSRVYTFSGLYTPMAPLLTDW